MTRQTRLNLRDNGSEVLLYNAPGYPLRSFAGCHLRDLIDYSAECHWHTDYEFILIEQGEMSFRVDGEEFRLREGDVLFVNSRRLHYGFSRERRDCLYAEAVFHPALLSGSDAVAQRMDLLSADESVNNFLFAAGEPETPQARSAVLRLCCHREPVDAMQAIQAMAELMALIMMKAQGSVRTADPAWAVLRRMVGYIQDHYREKISLEDIAAAGHVCRSRCCALFRERMDTTPNRFVTRYRLGQARTMLSGGSSVTEAAFSCGFQSTSFFTETFHKHYGITPTEYRKRLLGKEDDPLAQECLHFPSQHEASCRNNEMEYR
ncbi:MAG: AraC family transcriptional regulator [Acidaminococcaceae bacterium]|nr:AraC family transcriptional regulator [Acidaminococcaceae bacterium]